ncbi:MAG: OadG family protein [Clostridia bacterium]|jgi:ABC-type transport system involved in cytochrome bd biosynthesis fused ATPase/permease subunit
MAEHLQFSVIGFVIVILIMAAISLILMLIPIIFGKSNKKVKEKKVKIEKAKVDEVKIQETTPVQTSLVEDDNSELIAVITAAISAFASKDHKTLRVVSFRRVGDNSPAWSMASRVNN